MEFTPAADEVVPVLIVGGGGAGLTASMLLDGDLFDPWCAWLRLRQISSQGAILVRPDRFVAWRSPTAVDDPLSELAAALSQILARPLSGRPVPTGAGVAS